MATPELVAWVSVLVVRIGAAVLVAENTTASGEMNPVTLETASEILVYGCRLGRTHRMPYLAPVWPVHETGSAPGIFSTKVVKPDTSTVAVTPDVCSRSAAMQNNVRLPKLIWNELATDTTSRPVMQLAESTDGNPLSPTESVKRLSLLDKSCQNDAFGSACLRLGELYEHGDFGPVDPIRAVTYFSESCQRNNDQGCRQLARAYETGEGVPRDTNRAVEVLSQRCNLHVKEGPSCSDLGRMLLEGLGGTERITEGLAALQFACERNQAKACTMLGNHLLSHTTPNERAEAAPAL